MSMPITGSRLLAGVVVALAASMSFAGASAAAVARAPGTGSPAGAMALASDDTEPCSFTPTVSACQSTDPAIKTYVNFSGNTTGCVFEIAITWGDGSKVQNVFFTSPTDGLHLLAGHGYQYSNTPNTFTISLQGSVTAGQCGIGSG